MEYSTNWEERKCIKTLLVPYLMFCYLKECVNKHKNRNIPQSSGCWHV